MPTTTSTNKPVQILVADDEPLVRAVYIEMLQEEGYVCRGAADGGEALRLLDEGPCDLLLSDVRMPNVDGLTLLSAVGERFPNLSTIVVTAHSDVNLAVEATRRGAFDFLCKPVDSQELRLSVARALEQRRLLALTRKLTGQVERPPTFANLVGQSRAMLAVYRVIAQAAGTGMSILLTGESGTGKEEVARAIHSLSPRKENRLNVVNCAAIPEALIESVLFGHRRGAFTGATYDFQGLIGASDGGTVFFDEIGEMPLHLQPKLLRVIQERSFIPVGAGKEVEVDIRIISATNCDLSREVSEGRFRQDLFYRLNVIPIELPPLRERGEDIPELAFHFLDELASDFPDVTGISEQAMACMQAYPWPGNVRELRNAIERAVSLTGNTTIQLADLPEGVRAAEGMGYVLSSPSSVVEKLEDWQSYLQERKREYCSQVLTVYEGNVSHAARHAAMSRKAFYKILRDADLDPRAFR